MIRRAARHLMVRDDRIGETFRSVVASYEARLGPIHARLNFKEALAEGRSVGRALEVIGRRWPEVRSTSVEKPVFILSAGWRSGSTLLQRLVMSKQAILIWGEPYSHGLMLKHLAEGITAITDHWPESSWFVDAYDLQTLSSTFVANLYPSLPDLQSAYLRYMEALFIDPARTRGFCSWGIKDVRLTLDETRFLRWLYPEAKILFLVRNPFDAYRSYRAVGGWYHEWPHDPILTAKRFGQHWADLARGFLLGAEEVDAKLVRYEELVGGGLDLGELERYLGMPIDRELITKNVGSHKNMAAGLTGHEVRQLEKAVASVASLYGYHGV